MGVSPSGAILATSWLIVLVLVSVSVRSRSCTWVSRVEGWLSGRATTLLAGTISALLGCYVWGSLSDVAVVHDEQALLLQARLFAAGKWSTSPMLLPEFFEQAHVFPDPRMAAKYPPGHPLALVPGVWAGAPGLMPVLLVGITGGLIYSSVKRHSDVTSACAVWLLWSTSPIGLFWRSSYFSQVTSGALLALAAWLTLRWSTRRSGIVLSTCFTVVSLAYLTRPLTAMALGGPLVLLLSTDAVRARRVMALALAALLAAGVLSVNLLWHYKVTGDAMTSPYALYSRQYMPFDKPGFGVDATPPSRPVPAHMVWLANEFRPHHLRHTPARLPAILFERVTALVLMVGEQWRLALGALFVIGLVRGIIGPSRDISSLLVAALVGAYLIYAHPAGWTLYYVEALPIMLLVAVSELRRFAFGALGLSQRSASAAILLALVAALPLFVSDVVRARENRDQWAKGHRQFSALVARIAGDRVLLFVRYPPNHEHHVAVVGNSIDDTARVLIAHDRGPDNRRLMALTNRVPYLFDVGTGSVTLLPGRGPFGERSKP